MDLIKSSSFFIALFASTNKIIENSGTRFFHSKLDTRSNSNIKIPTNTKHRIIESLFNTNWVCLFLYLKIV